VPQNPGGPITDEDRADARALLGTVDSIGYEPQSAARPGRIGDHTSAGYDPTRIVRILTALREMLPREIHRWKYDRISRARAEEIWEQHLFSDHCATCDQLCDGCRETAEALGYKRVTLKNGRATWKRPPTTPNR
jgi:hypothetical protein